MKILPFTPTTYPTHTREICECLAAGGVIIFPTETCYGLGVDATNQNAVQRLLDYKGGRGNKPISIAVSNQTMAESYVELNSTAQSLYSTLLPGPITVISSYRGGVAPQLVSDMNTLGVRIPNYPLLLNLISTYGKPLTSTSANISGGKPPYSLDELKRYTSKKKLDLIDLFLDAGQLPVRSPSTVVDTTLNEPTIIRQGDISLPDSARVFGSHSVEETITTGVEIMNSLMELTNDSAILFALQGELGAGKTHLTKGIARALAVAEMVNSPTYTIVKEYDTPKTKHSLFHIDTWRLHDGNELLSLGLANMLKPGNVVVVEWPQKVLPVLTSLSPKPVIVWVHLTEVNETARNIRVYVED